MIYWQRGPPPLKMSNCDFSSAISDKEVWTEVQRCIHNIKVENSQFYDIIM